MPLYLLTGLRLTVCEDVTRYEISAGIGILVCTTLHQRSCLASPGILGESRTRLEHSRKFGLLAVRGSYMALATSLGFFLVRTTLCVSILIPQALFCEFGLEHECEYSTNSFVLAYMTMFRLLETSE